MREMDRYRHLRQERQPREALLCTDGRSRSAISALVKKRSAVGDFNTFGEAYCCRCQRKYHRLHYLRGPTYGHEPWILLVMKVNPQ
uniref:Uncharacterized protein n=1 Tax=Oreochromis niloticus TaxID=8128 RepID=A0A669CSY6_ORENI